MPSSGGDDAHVNVFFLVFGSFQVVVLVVLVVFGHCQWFLFCVFIGFLYNYKKSKA